MSAKLIPLCLPGQVSDILPQKMMKKGRRFIFSFIALLTLAFPDISIAKGIKPLPDFTQEDRVLVFAPHPGDEAIGTGGVIQRAIGVGAKVKVVCYCC